MGVIELSKCRIIDLYEDDAIMIIPHVKDITMGNVVNLAEEVRTLLKTIETRSFIIDLEDVEQIDSTVIGWIFEIYKKAKERGGDLILVVGQKQPREVCALVNAHCLPGLHIVHNKAATIDILSVR